VSADAVVSDAGIIGNESMKIIAVIALVLVLGMAGVVAFTYSGLFDVAATTREPNLVRWMLENTRKNSIQYRAEHIVEPESLGEARWITGGKAFDEMCAVCHGAPGQKPFLGAGDMNPPPPDLADIASQRTPKELFWVVKNGIRMTGMPAWGPTHTDAKIWDLVAFIKRVPELSPDAYRNLIDNAQGDGHGHNHGEKIPVTDGIHNNDHSSHSH
jgi:mono/diheme cytochrome c family protein